jgi:large subunit ribosomal protein L16
MKRRGKIWVRIFPDKPITKKAAETRMGKGKGAVDHWVAVVKPGRIIFELGGLPEEAAREAMRLAAFKFGLETKVIVRLETAHAEEK